MTAHTAGPDARDERALFTVRDNTSRSATAATAPAPASTISSSTVGL